jgi:hypothetical protein
MIIPVNDILNPWSEPADQVFILEVYFIMKNYLAIRSLMKVKKYFSDKKQKKIYKKNYFKVKYHKERNARIL